MPGGPGVRGSIRVSNQPRVQIDRGQRAGSGNVASQTATALFHLRESLMRGEFAPGERMSELPLVARLGVSRTPIRLALERLAHMGLLDVGAGGGFTVRGYTPSEALDAIEIRGVLEGTAARLATERLAGPEEVEPLRRLGREMDGLDRLTLESFAHYMDLNEAFHAAIIDLAKSAMVKRALEQAVSLPFASPSAMVFPTSGSPTPTRRWHSPSSSTVQSSMRSRRGRERAPSFWPANTPSSAGASWRWRSPTPMPSAGYQARR